MIFIKIIFNILKKKLSTWSPLWCFYLWIMLKSKTTQEYNDIAENKKILISRKSPDSFCILAEHQCPEKKQLAKKKLANETIFFEHKILKEYIGYQDQIAVSYGGLNHIEFRKKNFKVTNIKLTTKKRRELNQSILLCYTNRQRSASKIEKNKIKNINRHKKIYKEIYKITTDALKLIKSKNNKKWLKDFGNLVNKYWSLKKKLDKKVSNQYIDKLCKSFLKNGAYGVKLLGAGDGGFILILAKPKVQKRIIKNHGKLRFVKTKIEDGGSKIIYS